jgi:hypothetical protein
MVIAQPPLQYLITSSQAGLESFVLSRQGQVANLRREVLQVVEEWIEAETQSRTARWILECRRAQNAYGSPLDNLELAEFDYLPQPPALPAGTMPLFDNPCLPAESHFRPSARLNGYSPRDRPEPVVATEESSPEYLELSSRAEDALNLLEHHVRSQADAIDEGANNDFLEHAATDIFVDSAERAQLDEHRSSRIRSESFYAAVVTFSELTGARQPNLFGPEDDLRESAISETLRPCESPMLKNPNRVMRLPRRVHDRSFFPIRVRFAGIPHRRCAV